MSSSPPVWRRCMVSDETGRPDAPQPDIDLPSTITHGAERVGVYVCHCGGNISDVVDVDRVTREAAELDGVSVARHIMFMCSDEGQKAIVEDIQQLGLDRVVVAACTPTLHQTTFRRAVVRGGLNPYLFLPANVRERATGASAQSSGRDREGRPPGPRGRRQSAPTRAAGDGQCRRDPSGHGHRWRCGRLAGGSRPRQAGDRRRARGEVAVPGWSKHPAPYRLPDRGPGPPARPRIDPAGRRPA